jgi:hypothetical protein
MKIKVIDLLNKIANDEEVPKKIKIKNVIYEYRGYMYCTEKANYQDIEDYLFGKWNFNILNDYAEIIEEPKKIEKLDVALLGQCDNWLRCPTNKVTKQDVELNPYIIDNIRENTLYFQRKINELIDEINKLKEKK